MGQAIAGKMLQGAVPYQAEDRTHLVRLVPQEAAVVLAQQRVENKTKEIQGAPELFRERNLRNMVTTMDALLTQRTIARHIVDQPGDYLMVVKENQHELWAAIEVLFHASPLPRGEDDRPTVVTCDTAHGRLERRTLESSAALKDYLDWPGVNPVLRRTCRRVEVKTGRVSEEVTHGIASLSRQRGWKNVAAALRHFEASPVEA